MKKRLQLIAAFLILSTAGYAQTTFAPVGAEWWYGGKLFDYTFWDDFHIRWVDHMQSVKDTFLAGESCRMLTTTRYQKSVYNPNTVSIRYNDTFFLYNTEDTVFVYDEIISNFTPLYIFNVTAGDTVCLRKPNFSSSEMSAEFCIVIDSIKLETYDTVQLKSYYNHTVLDSGDFYGPFFSWGGPKYYPGPDPYTNAGKYTEKIGGNWPRHGSFFPNISVYNPDYYKESEEIPTGSLRCYYDAVTAIKMEAIPCDSVIRPLVSIPEITKSAYHVSVSPNPSTGTFLLTTQKPLKEALDIQVTDLSGRTMKRLSLQAGKTEMTCDLRQLSSGLYLLLFNTEGQRYYQKLVISR